MAALQAARMFALLEAPLICTGVKSQPLKLAGLLSFFLETRNAWPFWLSSVDHLCEVTVLSSNLPPLAFGAVEELVRRKRLQLAGVSIGRVVRHVSPSLHRDTLAIRCLYSFTT